MKKSILIAMVALFTYNAAKAGNVPPVPVLTSTPNQTWFYNLEDVVFSSSSSYDSDGYVNYSKFYINGVLKKSISYMGSYSTCFALYGSPAGDCYVLANGVTTVSVKLEVRDNSGEWSSTTTVYTIQQHKGRKYFLTDHLGNVRTTVNRDGNVLGYDDYYAFGLSMPGSHSSNTSNPNDTYKFTGHERDDEAGLTIDYMNARTYDPVIGRFMQVDPLSDQFPGWTPYHYVHNNPLKLTDPTGMMACDPPDDPCESTSSPLSSDQMSGVSKAAPYFDQAIEDLYSAFSAKIGYSKSIIGGDLTLGSFEASLGLELFNGSVKTSTEEVSVNGDIVTVEGGIKAFDILDESGSLTLFSGEASYNMEDQGLNFDGEFLDRDHGFSANVENVSINDDFKIGASGTFRKAKLSASMNMTKLGSAFNNFVYGAAAFLGEIVNIDL